MKAAVLRAYGEDLRIEDVALSDPKDREVLVRIGATGVCHSDLSAAKGLSRPRLPMILGHEASGTVERVGSAVSKVKPGDRVVLSWAPNCGHCFYCNEAQPTLCDVYGHAAGNGALWDGTFRLNTAAGHIHHFTCVASFAEFAVVPESGCVRIDEDIPFEVAALVGCAVTTGFGAVVNDARVQPGSFVAVFGIGGVGINAVHAAAVSGAERVIAVDINPHKEEVARAFGATDFVNSKDGDVVEALRGLTKGRGPDSVIECTGRPAVIASGFDAVRMGGVLVSVGISARDEHVTLPSYMLPNTQKRIIGSNYGGGVPERDFARILALYRSGRFDVDRQIGDRIPLEAVNDAFHKLETGVLARSVIVFEH